MLIDSHSKLRARVTHSKNEERKQLRVNHAPEVVRSLFGHWSQKNSFAQQQQQAVFVRYFNYINIHGDVGVLEKLPFCSLTALTKLVTLLMSLISI